MLISIHDPKFKDLIVLKPSIYQDKRGSFYECWRERDYKEAGIKESFVQDNVSVNHKNVLRGLHFQKNMGQMVTVTHGAIWDVVVDIRPSSPTFGQYYSIELSAESPQQVYMAPGFAHGFCVLTDLAIINYKCTQYYDPSQEGGVRWNDPNLSIPWPVKNPTLSEKDQKFPLLKDLK
ncbi:MAG: dTDP-4-dehydrorhamnose 3,5-epimerase [Alphaproteobacteria bacterium]